jgi:serine/threonine protein kinase
MLVEETRQEFIGEVEALRRCKERDMTHTIRLLSAFEYKGDMFLLFPWANNGDLENLWQKNKPPTPSPHFIQWFSTQWRGIAEDLTVLHDPEWQDEFSSEDSNHGESQSSSKPSGWPYFVSIWRGVVSAILSGLSRRRPLRIEAEEGVTAPLNRSSHGRGMGKSYGIHGDLTPWNFLCFDVSLDENTGTIQVADFGSCRFFSRHSRSRRKRKVAHQMWYRPPELDEDDEDMDKPYSAKYDVWSLGCVLLEFVSWLLLGYDEGITSFRRRREDEKDDMGNQGQQWDEGKFFNNIKDKSKTRIISRTVKTCVTNVRTSSLHASPVNYYPPTSSTVKRRCRNANRIFYILAHPQSQTAPVMRSISEKTTRLYWKKYASSCAGYKVHNGGLR